MGLAASVVEVLGGIVGVVADGLSVLFAFAGGVVRPCFSSPSFPLPFHHLTLDSNTHPYTLDSQSHLQFPILFSSSPPSPPQLRLTAPQAYAAKLGAHSCSRSDYTGFNSIINGGVKDGKFGPGINLKHRCQEAQADTAFIWFAFATALGCLALGLLSWRRGGK